METESGICKTGYEMIKQGKVRGVVTGLILAMGLSSFASVSFAQDAAAAQSPEYKRGRLLFIQCRACHDLQPSPVEKVGPNLAGLIGRPVAKAAGFNYSPALSSAKLAWDKATLDRWIEKPSAVVPGNTMAFAGIANAADRAALIRYIEVESAAR